MVSKIDNITNVSDTKIPYLESRLNETETEALIQGYLSELIEKKPDSPPSKGQDLIDFIDLVQDAVVSREEIEGVSSSRRLLFLEDDPPEELDTEAIAWKIKSRVPGKFDQGPAGQGRIKEVSAHCRSVVQHPDNPGEKLVTLGRFYDNWVSFEMYAKTNKVAIKRAFWFESLMDGFYWYFRLFGFKVIYQGMGEKETVKIGELTLTKYPLSFYVRLDHTFTISTQELRSFLLNVNVERN